jgi:hypothetical protein
LRRRRARRREDAKRHPAARARRLVRVARPVTLHHGSTCASVQVKLLCMCNRCSMTQLRPAHITSASPLPLRVHSLRVMCMYQLYRCTVHTDSSSSDS